MSRVYGTVFLVLGLLADCAQSQTAASPSQPTAPRAERATKGPPPNAYTDCQGKKAGDTVQHKTPEGVVSATCAESPGGLVARPVGKTPERTPAK